MDNSIKDALTAAFAGFERGNQEGQKNNSEVKSCFHEMQNVFETKAEFLEKVKLLDNCIDNYPHFDSIREYLFDLLMINFFASDALQLEEDYLDSPEWEAIEDKTLDRGTELLNLLLYLKECKEEEIDPELDDYLKEFLLVEDDEFQDEHAIYEDIIANQILIEAEYEEIARVQNSIAADSEIKEDFYTIVSFFSNTSYNEQEFNDYTHFSNNKSEDAAKLASLYAFYHGLDRFNKSFLTTIL